MAGYDFTKHEILINGRSKGEGPQKMEMYKAAYPAMRNDPLKVVDDVRNDLSTPEFLPNQRDLEADANRSMIVYLHQEKGSQYLRPQNLATPNELGEAIDDPGFTPQEFTRLRQIYRQDLYYITREIISGSAPFIGVGNDDVAGVIFLSRVKGDLYITFFSICVGAIKQNFSDDGDITKNLLSTHCVSAITYNLSDPAQLEPTNIYIQGAPDLPLDKSFGGAEDASFRQSAFLGASDTELSDFWTQALLSFDEGPLHFGPQFTEALEWANLRLIEIKLIPPTRDNLGSIEGMPEMPGEYDVQGREAIDQWCKRFKTPEERERLGRLFYRMSNKAAPYRIGVTVAEYIMHHAAPVDGLPAEEGVAAAGQGAPIDGEITEGFPAELVAHAQQFKEWATQSENRDKFMCSTPDNTEGEIPPGLPGMGPPLAQSTPYGKEPTTPRNQWHKTPTNHSKGHAPLRSWKTALKVTVIALAVGAGIAAAIFCPPLVGVIAGTAAGIALVEASAIMIGLQVGVGIGAAVSLGGIATVIGRCFGRSPDGQIRDISIDYNDERDPRVDNGPYGPVTPPQHRRNGDDSIVPDPMSPN